MIPDIALHEAELKELCLRFRVLWLEIKKYLYDVAEAARFEALPGDRTGVTVHSVCRS